MAALPKAFLLPTLTSPPEARLLGNMSPKFLRGKYGSCDQGEGRQVAAQPILQCQLLSGAWGQVHW